MLCPTPTALLSSHLFSTSGRSEFETKRLFLWFPLLLAIFSLNQSPIEAAGFSQPPKDANVQISSFAGSLSQGTGEGAILRKFEATLLLSDSGAFFNVLDDARTGCPWPESYGILRQNGHSEGPKPQISYPYNGSHYSIPLPFLFLNIPSDATMDTKWDHGGWQLSILDRREFEGVDCWYIEAREKRGRRQTLVVDADQGVLLQAQADVFMGQGDQFKMSIKRISTRTLETITADRTAQIIDLLLQLQRELGRRPDTQLTELSERQVETVAKAQPVLHSLSADTPLQELVTRVSTDVKRQSQRVAATIARAGQLMNGQSPEFSVNILNGGVIDSQSLRGKIVVLHFWDYRDQPLTEPYGQTGYLDFLFNQRKKLNVEVIGVTTSPDLQTAEGLSRGKRAARKLAEFMNLTYPITYDDGSLLRAMGDPRDSSGQLPLWVVLSPDGKIVHYHAGFYEVDVAKGLSQLDEVISEQLKATRSR